MTRLCAAILVTSIAQAKRDIAEALEAGAEMIELRMDPLPDVPAAIELQKICSVPCVVTCRSRTEGGQCDLSDAERCAFLHDATEKSGNLVDVEFATLRRNHCPVHPGNLIVSAHFFQGRPPRLYNLLEEMTERAAAVNKVSWMPRSIRDCQEAFELLQARSRPTIAICMGEAGAITRILAKKFGGYLTFAAVRGDARTAPGQPTIEDLKTIYRWDSIKHETHVYGVIGSPIAHSMSPAVHNAAFEDSDISAVYVPLLVNEGYESFKAFMETYVTGAGPLQLEGLSITIPHKENAYRYLVEKGAAAHIDADAGYIRSVNTIAVRREGRSVTLHGCNTDHLAILDSITSLLKCDRSELRKLKVAVLGAGGTGRTAVAALAALGASIVVYNRTSERGEELADEFNAHHGNVMSAPWETMHEGTFDLYINTTSVGMSPHVHDSPFGDRPPKLLPQTIVFDTVYNPVKTRLLQQAEAAGCRQVSGVEMFVRQAAAQFELWTRHPAPVEAMRKAIEQRLAS